jgi:hypothetical protein
VAGPRKPHLVVCRADARSVHRSWLGDPAARSYDVWLDCFADGEGRWDGEPARVSVGQGTTKFRRIQALGRERPELFEYDHVWLPDDDVRIDPAGLEALFRAMRAHGLDLAQPALARGSFHTHVQTLRHPAFTLRYTNFVEMMAPAFSRRGLSACIGTFSENVSGLGLDMAWAAVLGWPRDRIAVVDAVTMVHTRPVGGPPDVWWAKLGLTVEGELARILGPRGIDFRMHEYGGISRSGEPVGTGTGFVVRLLRPPAPWLLRRGRYWRGHLRALRAGRRGPPS